ncbi:hypothetical protein [Mariprofundus ferrooxydans]|uniref:Mu-like prophage FluMu protein gp28 n=1 Tax=Mariprofundus ferrooxydans PV-1 TaxID=314345 RepID=Q0EWD3_9PROT|nr:hypothetical protein [Mariprofundus ferrooxydans]EAU53538.1 hypothetical protein SPV1_02833 [Mariprofundus ferrooxydans PV-1]KON47012.1 hypothetical protein AL013_10500 [Mariprofundus ferrooxydans]
MAQLTDGVLLKGQRDWVADPSPLKVIPKGRRTGITWAEASDDVLIAAASKAAGGQNVYYYPQSKEDAIEYIETCAKWAKAYNKVCGSMEEGSWEDELGMVLPEGDPDKAIKTYTIKFPSSFKIQALSSAPARARGKQGVFVLDEGAFHPNLPGVLKSVVAAILRGGKVRVISTHDGEENPFNQLIEEIRAGRRKGTVHDYPFRKAVADGMYKRICELNGEEWSQEKEDQWVLDAYAFYGEDADEELDAIPSAGSGVYLAGILIEKRMRNAPVLRMEYDDAFSLKPIPERRSICEAWLDDHLKPVLDMLNPKLEHSYGQDFGRTGDLSVIPVLATQPNLDRIEQFVLEMRKVPYDQQEQVLDYIIPKLPRFTAGKHDARGNGQALAEYAASHYGHNRIEQVMLTEGWYRDNMPQLKTAFEDGTISICKSADHRTDLRAIQMIKGVARIPDSYKGKGTDGKQRHADYAVALALAYAASLADVAPIEWTPAPIARSRWDDVAGDDGGGRDDVLRDSRDGGSGAW